MTRSQLLEVLVAVELLLIVVFVRLRVAGAPRFWDWLAEMTPVDWAAFGLGVVLAFVFTAVVWA